MGISGILCVSQENKHKKTKRKNVMNNATVRSVSLEIASLSAPVRLSLDSQGILRITFAGTCIAYCAKGCNPRKTLAAWIATLPADAQLDTLEAIREHARTLCPQHVSERATLALYPDVTVKI